MEIYNEEKGKNIFLAKEYFVWLNEIRLVDSSKNKFKWDVEELIEPIFLQKELESLSQQFLMMSEFQKKIKLKQISKQKKITIKQILKEIREYKKWIIKSNENWNIRHFHRTSIKNFELIAQMWKLLSRTKLKEKIPDMKLMWSSSDDIMMTRDKFDWDWNITELGFYDKEVVWASWSWIIFVFKDSIMDKEDYDIIGFYPTISELSLQDYCEIILVDSLDDYNYVKEILSINNLDISVNIKSNWKRN